MVATPVSSSERLPSTLGLATTCHWEPFQCSTRVRPPWPSPEEPTAQTLLAERAATPIRVSLVPPFALETLLHTPQVLGVRVDCRIPVDVPAHPLRTSPASARAVM